MLRGALQLPIALLGSLVLPLGLVAESLAGEAPSPADQEPAEEELLLRRAEQHVERGRYELAVQTYRGLARRFPDTEAGRIGERRSQASAFLGSSTIVDHGPAANRVVIAILAEGYTLGHQRAFDKLGG